MMVGPHKDCITFLSGCPILWGCFSCTRCESYWRFKARGISSAVLCCVRDLWVCSAEEGSHVFGLFVVNARSLLSLTCRAEYVWPNIIGWNRPGNRKGVRAFHWISPYNEMAVESSSHLCYMGKEFNLSQQLNVCLTV